MVKLSVIIPCYNEENRLRATLNKLDKYLNKNHIYYELIIVDDGSTDKSRAVALQHNAILNKKRKNKGKGFSVSEGVFMATGDYILFMDADGSTDIKEIKKFMRYIKKYDIVIGSRNMKDSKVKTSITRKIFGRLSNLLISLVVKDIKDTQCGFKMFKLKTAVELFKRQTIDRWGFDFEILYLAQRYGHSIKELGVTWNNSEGSKVKIKDYPMTFIELIKIKRNNYD